MWFLSKGPTDLRSSLFCSHWSFHARCIPLPTFCPWSLPHSFALAVHRVETVPLAALQLSRPQIQQWHWSVLLTCGPLPYHSESESTRWNFCIPLHKQPGTQCMFCWAVGDSQLNVTSLLWCSDKQDTLTRCEAFGFHHITVMCKLSCECDDRVLSTPSAGHLFVYATECLLVF